MTIRHLQLEPVSPVLDSLDFKWDDETGELDGRDAARVRELVEGAIAEGWAPIEPGPSSFPITDPLHNLAELAAVLGARHRLPEWLREHYPAVSSDEEDLPGRVY